MKCPKCQTDNPSSSKFCSECAAPLRGHVPDSPESGTGPPNSQSAFPMATETMKTPVKELTSGSTFAGRYQMIEELGHGGMGKVYRAVDKKLNEEVAIKLIKPEIARDKDTLTRFQNELKVARKISHRNVGRMYELMEDQGLHFITMEYVPGEDLRSFLHRAKRLTVGTAVDIAKDVCEGLAEAHRLGVIHRDLKPSNIIIDKDGNARIMDFGIARSLRTKSITGEGVIIGTPEYMSPEQVEGKDVDQRSDIYSLGVILYEMVTGRVPFEGETPFTVGVKHKSEAPRDPRQLNAQIPEDLSRVILRCLEKDADKRYPKAEEFGADLKRFEEGLPTTDTSVPKRKPLTSREITVKFNLKKIRVPLAAAITIAAAAIALWIFIPRKKAPAVPKIENSIAVISFLNQTGDRSFDYLQEAIPNLLITNLENSGLFYVVTWERMQDVLKQMGVKAAQTIDSDLGFELCRREGIKAIAIGSFTKAGDVFRTDVKVLDAGTKRLLKSANLKGTGIDSILDSQIDALSRDISLGLGIEMAKIETVPLKVKDITTQSLRAYEYFLKGKDAVNMLFWEEAKKNLRAALEIDPSFVMASVYLARAYDNTGDTKARNETIEKAMAVSNKASHKDRLYLEASYALFIKQDLNKHEALLKELIQKYPDEKWAFHYLGDFLWNYRDDMPGAASQFEKWIALDPQDANGISHLINVLTWLGDFKKATEYIKRHEDVAPPDPYNLFVQSNMYAVMGQFDKAIAKCKEALAIRPDFIYALFNLALIHGVREEYEESLRWSDEYVSRASSPGLKSDAYCQRGFFNYWRGRFKDALNDFTLADRMAEEAENWSYKAGALEGKGILYQAKGEFELSRKAFEDELKINVERVHSWIAFAKAYMAWRLGFLAAEQGLTGQAEAKRSEMDAILPEIKGRDNGLLTALRDLLQGQALFAQGNLDAALVAAQKACGTGSPYWSQSYMWRMTAYSSYPMDLTARILAKKGETAKAISEYERLFHIDARSAFLVHPLYHYRLGLLQEKAGAVAKAKAEYTRFLDLWKDADPGQPEVEDVGKRLEALKAPQK